MTETGDKNQSEDTGNPIEFSDEAQSYLAGLLEQRKPDLVHIRIFVTDPGTPKAETCVAYCTDGDQQQSDRAFVLGGFTAYIEERSLAFLEDARIDYVKDTLGGQLTIRAPNARMPRIGEDSSLEDRVNYLLWNEINPMLASHGGQVSLVEIAEDNVVVLQFGGGCQGCGMVDITLKDGIESTLKEKLPEISAVTDITDHSIRENAWFKG